MHIEVGANASRRRTPRVASSLVLGLLLASPSACTVGRSVLAPNDDASVGLDRTVRPDAGTPADVGGDSGAGAKCGETLRMILPMCSSAPSFWPCITSLRPRLAGDELARFNALATCVEAACGPNPTEMCASSSCFREFAACDRTCEGSGSCAVTCTDTDCRAHVARCSDGLAGAEAARFAALRTCLEQTCGPTLPSSCLNAPGTASACSAQLSACGLGSPPTDAGTPPADVPLPGDAGMDCATGLSQCGRVCVNLQTSAAHCGVCDAPCPATTVCMGGTCVGTGTCMPPQTACMQAGASVCVNTLTNPAHCGRCNNACPGTQTCVNGACVGTGALRFTLTWDRASDVDLHVTPPCGFNIYYTAPRACEGELDRDDTTGTGPENMFFTSMAQRGNYLLCIVPFARISDPTVATLRVFEGATLRRTITRTLTASNASNACTRTSPDFVGEYTY
jgi:hypothetical protein